jgi:hypothetical protein
MNHYDKALIAYYIAQGADIEQIQHILGQQIIWK